MYISHALFAESQWDTFTESHSAFMIICAIHNVPLHGFNRHHYEPCLTVFSRSENAAWHAPKEISYAENSETIEIHSPVLGLVGDCVNI